MLLRVLQTYATPEKKFRRAFNFKDVQFFLIKVENSATVSCWRILTCTVLGLPFFNQFFKSYVPKCLCHKDSGTNWSSCTFHIFCEIYLNGIFSMEGKSKCVGFFKLIWTLPTVEFTFIPMFFFSYLCFVILRNSVYNDSIFL